jgi:predicted transcriptional regulator
LLHGHEEVALLASQAPIKVSEQTKERIRYLAALTDVTQAEVVDRAVEEYAARHADAIAAGIERARVVLAGGDVAIAAHLLNVPEEDIQRIAGGRRTG